MSPLDHRAYRRWLPWLGAAIALACFALQLAAYDESWLTAAHPRQCLFLGFGDCESIMASGYASIVPKQHLDLEAAAARLVPLVMWLSLAVAVIRPRWPWLAGGVVLAVLMSLGALHRRPSPQPVPVPARVGPAPVSPAPG